MNFFKKMQGRDLYIINIIFLLPIIWMHRKIWFFNDSFLFNYFETDIRIYIGFLFVGSLLFFLVLQKYRHYISLFQGFLLLLLFIYNPFLLQPFYLYFLISTLLFVFDEDNFISNMFVFVLLIYSISGLQKINPFFLSEVVPYFLNINLGIVSVVVGIGIILGEIFIPLLFIRAPKKKLYWYMFLGMNFGIICIGIMDSNIDISVLVWVILLILIVAISRHVSFSPMIKRSSSKYIFSLVVLFAFLAYGGLVPAYTTFKIYSGNTNVAYLEKNNQIMSIEYWFFERYRLFPLPYFRIHTKIFSLLCNSEDYLYIYNKESWLWGKELVSKYPCKK